MFQVSPATQKSVFPGLLRKSPGQKSAPTTADVTNAQSTGFNAIPGQTCGVPASESRIVGGQEASDAEQFPWQARFQSCTDGYGCGLCGASIISNRWLISAAHCTIDDNGFAPTYANPATSSVRVGQIQNSQSSPSLVRGTRC